MVKVLAFCTVMFAACTTNHPEDAPDCGDGVITPGVNGTGEECDDGNKLSGDGCSSTCKIEPAVCGNHTVETGEECDDGNTTSGDGCSATCKTETPVCGNGHVETGEDCDDGNTTNGDGCSSTCQNEAPANPHTISASWTLKLINNTVVPCPVGYDSAALYSQKVDASGNAIGAPIVDVFNCNSPGVGLTTPLAAGLYDVSLEIQNHALTMTYASTIIARVDLTTTDKTFSAEIFTDGGYFDLSWKLVKASNMAAMVTCAQAGVGAMGGTEILSTDSSNTATSDIFTCEDGSGTTAVLPAGAYTVSVDVFNNAMAAVGTADPITTAIMGPNKVTHLGLVTIPIDAL